MKATISWWNLEKSEQTVDSLRGSLNAEGVSLWEGVSGMHSKAWISDRASNLWGAVVIWDSPEAMNQPLPPNRATELIGYPPSVRVTFDVEALIEEHITRHWLVDEAFKDVR